MNISNTTSEYIDFKDFYLNIVLPLKKEHPDYIRLDGKIVGSTRKIAGYFWYKNIKWKVDADTYMDRLKMAFNEYEKNEEPFIIKHTRDKKGLYLTIQGQPVRNNKFHVYKVVERLS